MNMTPILGGCEFCGAMDHPTYYCPHKQAISEQRAFMAEWHKLAATPGAVITSFDQVKIGQWVERKYRVEEDGSRTLISEKQWTPGEAEPSDAD